MILQLDSQYFGLDEIYVQVVTLSYNILQSGVTSHIECLYFSESTLRCKDDQQRMLAFPHFFESLQNLQERGSLNHVYRPALNSSPVERIRRRWILGPRTTSIAEYSSCFWFKDVESSYLFVL